MGYDWRKLGYSKNPYSRKTDYTSGDGVGRRYPPELEKVGYEKRKWYELSKMDEEVEKEEGKYELEEKTESEETDTEEAESEDELEEPSDEFIEDEEIEELLRAAEEIEDDLLDDELYY